MRPLSSFVGDQLLVGLRFGDGGEFRRYQVPLPACLRASGRMRRACGRMGRDNLTVLFRNVVCCLGRGSLHTVPPGVSAGDSKAYEYASAGGCFGAVAREVKTNRRLR